MSAESRLNLSVLIIIPGIVSYFYDLEGRRVAEALNTLGCRVEVHTLWTYPQESYDWCFLLNLSEITLAYGNDSRGVIRHINQLKKQCTRIGMILLESVAVTWFDQSFKLFKQANLKYLIDMGFHNQYERAAKDVQNVYHFVFNGLTQKERRQAAFTLEQTTNRPIPWAFVGHMTPHRLQFIQQLITQFNPRGFIYMIHFTPVTDDGPHLNHQQLHRVLQKTRLKIWCSHHASFYIESIRFRLALMAGALPIKVNLFGHQTDPGLPFPYLIFNQDEFIQKIRSINFKKTYERFVDEFCSYPSLESEFFRLLSTIAQSVSEVSLQHTNAYDQRGQ